MSVSEFISDMKDVIDERLPNLQYLSCWICLLLLTRLPPDPPVNPIGKGHLRNCTPVV